MADKNVRVKFTATDQTGKAVSGLEKRLAGLKSAVTRIGVAIAGAFAVTKIAAFGRSVFTETAKARDELGRLSGAIENLGTASAGALPAARALVDALADMSGRDDGDISDALANLITKTGSLDTAMANMGLVLDIAAKKQIELGAASDLVAQALAGNERAFKQLGIVTGTHAEKMEELRKRYGGFAEKEGKDLTGQIGRLSNAWNDVKKAIGEALASSANGTPVFRSLTDALVNLAKAVAANPAAIQAMGRAFLWVARWTIGPFVWIVGESVRMLAAFTYAIVGVNRGMIAIRSAFGLTSPEIEKTNAALMDQVRAFEKIANSANKAAHAILGTQKGKMGAATNADLAILKGGTATTGAGAGGAVDGVDTDKDTTDKTVKNNEDVAASIEQIGDDAETARAAVEELMRITSAKGVIRFVAQKAKVKAGEATAHAIEEYAAGTAASAVGNPAAAVHFAAAKTYAVSALKWAALGAGASAAAGGGSGGGGGSSSARADGDRLAGSGRGSTTVIFPAGRKVILDPTNADDVDGFAKFVESLAGQNVQIRYSNG